MKKADIVLILLMMAVSLVLLIPAFSASAEGSVAVVQVKGDEVYRLSLLEDQVVEVEGTLGAVRIEVKDGKVAVVEENSPHHYCSIQGFTNNPATPIICLPNETMVTIISDENSQEDLIIQ